MIRINFADLGYAARHPLRAIRYLLHRDNIPYEVCLRHLPAAPVIVEAGAFDGSNTMEFVQRWPGSRVYAFEPVPSAYSRLAAVARDFPGRILPQACAIGRKAGTASMHVSGGDDRGEQSSSLLEPTRTLAEFPFVTFPGRTIKVVVESLDSWAEARQVKRVDFLWLDLQGLELEALCGAERLLAGCSAIHCEVQNIELYRGAPLYPEVRSWLSQRGFHPVCEAIFRRGGNVLFTR